MKFVICLSLCLFVTAAFGQGIPGYNAIVNSQQPTAVLNQQAIVPPMYPQQELPVGEWHEGLHESWVHQDVHEIRPIRPWEYPQPVQYPQQYQQWSYPQYLQTQSQYQQCWPQQYYYPCQQQYPCQQWYYRPYCPWYR